MAYVLFPTRYEPTTYRPFLGGSTRINRSLPSSRIASRALPKTSKGNSHTHRLVRIFSNAENPVGIQGRKAWCTRQPLRLYGADQPAPRCGLAPNDVIGCLLPCSGHRTGVLRLPTELALSPHSPVG